MKTLTLLLMAALLAATPAHALDVSSARQLPVLEGGRSKPFDTYCREALLSIYDEETYAGMDPVEMILSMAFQPEKWHDRNIIALSYRPHRQMLDLEGDAFTEGKPLGDRKSMKRSTASYVELLKNPAFKKMVEELEAAQQKGKELSERQKEDSRLYGRVATVDMIFGSKAFHMIPMANKPEAPWFAPGEMEGAPVFATYVNAWKEVGKQYNAGDQAAFDGAVKKLTDLLAKVDPKNYPSASNISLEVTYNAVRPFRTAALLYAAVLFLLLAHTVGRSLVMLFFGLLFTAVGGAVVTGAGIPAAAMLAMPGWVKASVAPALLSAGLAMVAGFAGRGAKWLKWVAMAFLVVGWSLHTGGIVARVILSDRGPISNMFESMIYLGWGAVTFSLGFGIFHGVTYFGMAACAVASVMLLSAENSFDPFIAPLVPVLRSYWLWIHVQVIMLGYAGLFMAIAMGHLRLLFTLGGDAQLAKARAIDPLLHRAIQLGSACLGTGIVLGGIWADYSWGRYWGWDPKETWALITFLCYMALLHGRFAGWLNGPSVALGTVLGIFPFLMTYYGVNFLLVGLHSYASAEMNAGATFLDKLLEVPSWLSMLVLFELVFTQLVDAVLLRDGRLTGGILVFETLFLTAVWTKKVPAGLPLILLAQVAVSIVLWKRRDALLKTGHAARLVMLLSFLMVPPGLMASPALAAGSLIALAVIAGIVGPQHAGLPSAAQPEPEMLCSRCANETLVLKLKKADSQPSGGDAVRAACWCEPCVNVFCGKCCGLSTSAAALSFAKCPECEKPVEWAKDEHKARLKTRPEAQFQPDVA